MSTVLPWAKALDKTARNQVLPDFGYDEKRIKPTITHALL
jgi:hypothetical protein